MEGMHLVGGVEDHLGAVLDLLVEVAHVVVEISETARVSVQGVLQNVMMRILYPVAVETRK